MVDMLGQAYQGQDCSIARSLEVVGERWTILILRDLFFGVSRFDDLQRGIGLAPNILTSRLRRLCDEGVVQRRQYQQAPPRWEYVLTDKGLGLGPILFYLAKWGDQHYPSELGPPRLSVHHGCGGDVDEQRICARCGQLIGFDQIDTVPRSDPAK